MLLIKHKCVIQYNELLCDIPNWYTIPASTIFRHKGIGVVISSNVKLGENISIGQQVTLGTRGGSHTGPNDYPTIEDNVVIHEHASVLGNVTVGHDSVIGSHSLVLSDIPPHSLAVGVPAVVVKNYLESKE